MSHQGACLFPYVEYRQEMRFFVQQVDSGNVEPLRERTIEAIRKMQREWPREIVDWASETELTQTWPLLNESWDTLATVEEVAQIAQPSPCDLGRWFLTVLASCLKPCVSPRGNYMVLGEVVEVLGWSDEDVSLLRAGLPNHLLLKPDECRPAPRPLSVSTPYWFWLLCRGAWCGWLPLDEINRLEKALVQFAPEIDRFDLRRYPCINIDDPLVLRDYAVYLRDAYRDSLAMLRAALAAGQGLFLSVLYLV